MEFIRFLRIRVTEDAARAAALNDLEAFKKAFPDVKLKPHVMGHPDDGFEYPENKEYVLYVLRERYADYGLIGCFVEIMVDLDDENKPLDRESIGTWIDLYNTAKQLEANPNRL